MQSCNYFTFTLYIITLSAIHSEHVAQLNANGSPLECSAILGPFSHYGVSSTATTGQPAAFKDTRTRPLASTLVTHLTLFQI